MFELGICEAGDFEDLEIRKPQVNVSLFELDIEVL